MKATKIAVILCLVGVIVSGVTTFAQQASPVSHQQTRLLLVDETRTFSSTIRVGVLATVLKKTGMFAISAKLLDVQSSYADPLATLKPAPHPYDVILIIPRGIDDGTVHQIWVVTRSFATLSPPVMKAIHVLEGVVNKVFAKTARAIDVNADLFPGFFSALYVEEGWL